MLRADGSDARKVVEFPFVTFSGVDWSPDGAQLVYSALVNGRMQLFSVPSAGGRPHRLTDSAVHLLHPQFSPDGKHIAATRLVQRKSIMRMKLPAPLVR